MVQIDYINGDSETVETVQNDFYRNNHFVYDKDLEMFIILDHAKTGDCMMIPREFVKSIRHIEV